MRSYSPGGAGNLASSVANESNLTRIAAGLTLFYKFKALLFPASLENS